ncbi:MAG: hypothetical protein IKL79_02550 [Clostridia bacterium]|nr:hypothetical protein [Clostridia bacterium]MBR3680868.1 hypothetical protein [Clostridia bacterium]
MLKRIFEGTPFLLPADGHNRALMHSAVASLHGVEHITLGYSIRRRPIDMYKFGKGRGRVVFFGTHHALESITANILYTFVYTLNGGERLDLYDGEVPELYTSLYTYYVVPCLNPDGVEIRFSGDKLSPIFPRVAKMADGDFSSWQANARGVDLNHNYEYGFAEYKAVEAARGIRAGVSLYSGEYPESEPESRLAANLVRILKPRAVVSLHTQGEEIFYAPTDACRAARALGRICGYSVGLPTDTALYGGLCDYTGYALSIPSFTLEIGRGKNPLPESDVPAALKRVGPALLTLPKYV